MIAWWIAQLALLGVLLAAAAYGAESALTTAGRPTRWAWVSALALTLILGILAPLRLFTPTASVARWQPNATTVVTTPVSTSTDAFTWLRDVWHDVTTLGATQVQRAWSVWYASVPSGTEQWLLIGWAVCSVALLVAFVGVHVRYQRRRAHWPLGTVHGTTVRIASDTGPAVIGVTNAEIVLPQWLLSRDDREQQLVLAHELEHVRVHDPLLLALAQMVVVLMPWHPAAWWMASRLRLAVELDCDRRVLQRGASARDYGTLLIDLTDHRTTFGAALPAFSCSPSNLERRLVAMTPKRLRYPLIRVLSTGALASLAVLAACEAKLPTADEMDRMTASSATTAAGRVALVDTTNLTYYVNDVQVSKADADKVAAERIASVNVMKINGEGSVRIVTRAEGDTASGPQRRMVRDSVIIIGPGSTSGGEVRTRTGFTGLMIVDGVITDPAVANSISPDQIVSVDVIKGPSATAQYSDPRAANGVIKITTKKAAKP